jgi:hypothetical protein
VNVPAVRRLSSLAPRPDGQPRLWVAEALFELPKAHLCRPGGPGGVGGVGVFLLSPCAFCPPRFPVCFPPPPPPPHLRGQFVKTTIRIRS